VVGNSYGAGNYAMCGRAYDPRLMVAWPTAKIAVMGGQQAAKTMLQIRLRTMEKRGEEPSEDEQEQMLREIEDRYEETTTPYYAAARLWVDAVIAPADTRSVLARGLAMANLNPEIEDFNPGVIQT